MKVGASIERWPIARPFTIARGTKTSADVVVATIDDGERCGRGECVPYGRFGESVAQVAAAINAFNGPFDRQALLAAMPAGAARNAIDCALWDLESQRAKQPVWQLAGLPRPVDVVTAFTLSMDTPAAMGERATAELISSAAETETGLRRCIGGHRAAWRRARECAGSTPHRRRQRGLVLGGAGTLPAGGNGSASGID